VHGLPFKAVMSVDVCILVTTLEIESYSIHIKKQAVVTHNFRGESEILWGFPLPNSPTALLVSKY